MANAVRIEALQLARELMRCPSVTPEDAGALDVLCRALTPLGFACHRLRFEEAGTPPVSNLYARFGTARPHFCYAGHTDVVPPGDLAAWRYAPFAATVAEDQLHGRGAVDMKGAIACFATAVQRYLARHGPPPGSISLLITGDEEGPAINGTIKVLEWLARQGERIDACVVGEPTSRARLGDTIKIGRRGSLNGRLTVRGTQGHVAYPDLADNPIPRLMRMLSALTAAPLDRGSAYFQSSNLEITTIDVGNPVTNLIPALARAGFNIRFNDHHSGAALVRWLGERCASVGGDFELATAVSGEAFLTPPGRLSQLLVAAIARVTGAAPELSTSGGTSDARFIKDYCAVVEFGLVGQTMHKIDERTPLADLARLTDIYEQVLEGFFTGAMR